MVLIRPERQAILTTSNKYHRAQADRMKGLIDTAQKRLRRAEEGKDSYRDDDVFVIGKGETGPLFRLDLSIAHSTVNPQKLLKNDGSVVMQISRKCPVGDAHSRGSVRLV
jgi:hypothetical protein